MFCLDIYVFFFGLDWSSEWVGMVLLENFVVRDMLFFVFKLCIFVFEF